MHHGKTFALGSLAIAACLVLAAAVARPLMESLRLRKLEDADLEKRRAAARQLMAMGSLRGVQRLLEIPSIEGPVALCLDDANLELITSMGTRAVPALLAGLDDRQDVVRARSAFALGRLREPGTAPALIRALADRSPGVQASVIHALARLGAGARDVIPRIAGALESEDETARSGAAQALGAMGPGGGEASPALVRALKDSSPLVRIHAAWALGDIGPGPAAVPSLTTALRDEVDNVRRAAARTFTLMDKDDARAALPALEAALRDEYSGVRDYASEAIGRIQGLPTKVR